MWFDRLRSEEIKSVLAKQAEIVAINDELMANQASLRMKCEALEKEVEALKANGSYQQGKSSSYER